MVILLVCTVFVPLLAPDDPTQISMLDAKFTPGDNLTYPLGTDIMGRDMLSRLIYGARTAVFISLIALGTGAFVGTVLGLVAGFRGGSVDTLTMRAADAALGFPTILILLVNSHWPNITAANLGWRVVAGGVPASHSPNRIRLMAAAVITWHRWVLSQPL
jgi:peptide/nickel transport system permease protein